SQHCTHRLPDALTEHLPEHDVKLRLPYTSLTSTRLNESLSSFADLRPTSSPYVLAATQVLLREGLDMPEVSLVAILDADKEGFLRSERSLIQTIGRAARNLHGKAILYADSITKSMKKAMDETERRREKQQAYNEKMGIQPQALKRNIKDIMELGDITKSRKQKVSKTVPLSKVAEPSLSYNVLTPQQLEKEITKLEAQMYKHAQNLEFELAAQKRDEIEKLRQQFIANS
uniref:helicase C-terminal domain-containing protein n=1 Tax=Vibrio vulnificus TaxID=672 RepID=UPI001EEB1379